HRLQHVQRGAVADLTDDDAVGAHPQRVAHQVPYGHLPAPLDVGGPGLQPQHVVLVQLQLGRVLDGDDALVGRQVLGKHVQGGRLAGAGTAGDEHVEPATHAGGEEVGHRAGERAEPDEVV